jgi:hypothetical protein
MQNRQRRLPLFRESSAAFSRFCEVFFGRWISGNRDLQTFQSSAYRTPCAFPDISVGVASPCKSPLISSGGWGVGSSDNMHSGDSLQDELRATVLGVLLQISISAVELITKQSPGPTKQHSSEAMATPGKSNSRISSNFMGVSLSGF